jgi:hypothetical protein
MSEWSHLSNAVHIDRVLASLTEHPEIWGAAWSAARSAAYGAARDKAYGAARSAAYGAARDEAYGAAWSAARDAVRGAAWNAAQDAAWNAAQGVSYYAAQSAILALIAYDDCDQYLNMSSEELKVWAYLSEHPAAILLLPAVVAFEQIRELESV